MHPGECDSDLRRRHGDSGLPDHHASSFSGEAVAYAASIETKVILIAGAQLAELMIDYGVGVTTEATYELKRIDADYFADE